jgi:hypothetical protein
LVASGDKRRLPLPAGRDSSVDVDADAGHAVDGHAFYVNAAAGADMPHVRALSGSL